jgi:hypothetical protein
MFATPTALPTTSSIATAAALPEALLIADVPTTTTPVPTAIIPQVAQVPTALPNAPDAITPATAGLPTWLLIGLGVQVVVLIAAGIEFFRRNR